MCKDNMTRMTPWRAALLCAGLAMGCSKDVESERIGSWLFETQ